MLGISLTEFLVIIILLVAITNPRDIPTIAKQCTKYFFKIKNMFLQIKDEVGRVSQDLGLQQLKEEAEAEIQKEQEELRRTTIIDIYGNEHEVRDLEKIRGDLAKEDLQAEIEKHNEMNSQNNKEKN